MQQKLTHFESSTFPTMRLIRNFSWLGCVSAVRISLFNCLKCFFELLAQTDKLNPSIDVSLWNLLKWQIFIALHSIYLRHCYFAMNLILLTKMENGRQWIGIYFTSFVVFQSRLPIRMKRRYDANNMQLTWSTLKRKSIGWLI